MLGFLTLKFHWPKLLAMEAKAKEQAREKPEEQKPELKQEVPREISLHPLRDLRAQRDPMGASKQRLAGRKQRRSVGPR